MGKCRRSRAPLGSRLMGLNWRGGHALSRHRPVSPQCGARLPPADPLSALSVLVRTLARVVPLPPTLVAGRTYVGLLRDRTHLETGGPDEDGGPHPAA